MAAVIDTLAYADRLKQAGFAPAQAEGMARALADTVDQAAVSKADLSDLRAELKAEIAALRTELKAEIADLRTELKAEIANTKIEMIKWVIGVALAQFALTMGAIRLMLP